MENNETSFFKKPGLAQAGMVYSVVMLLFLVIGNRVQAKEFYSGILITEFLLIMGAPLVFLLIGRYDLKKVLRLNRISLLNLFLIFCIMLFAIPLAGVFNMLNLWIVNSIFGKIVLPQIPVANTWMELLVNVLVIGGSAGICEEFAFRGTIQRGFERFGAVKSILITALLFGLMHLDFQRLFGTFILGALIGFIVYRSNSLYGGMLAHFTNNSASVVLGFIMKKFTDFMANSGAKIPDTQNTENFFKAFQNMPREQVLITVMIWGVMLFFFAAAFIALVYAFIRTTRGLPENLSRKGAMQEDAGTGSRFAGLWTLIPGAAFVVIIYVVQAFRFKGIDNGLVHAVLKIISG